MNIKSINKFKFFLGSSIKPTINDLIKKINDILDYLNDEPKEYIALISQIGLDVPTTYTVNRSINSSTFQVSTSRHADAIYNIGISCTASIGGNASGLVQLQYSIDGGSTWLNASRIKNSNSVSLAITLNSINEQEVELVVLNIPANARLKIVPTQSGTTTITSILGFETY